jgi:hypothetical protein
LSRQQSVITPFESMSRNTSSDSPIPANWDNSRRLESLSRGFIISTVHGIPLRLAEPFVRTRSRASGTSEGRAAIRRPDGEATTANIGATDGQQLLVMRVRMEGRMRDANWRRGGNAKRIGYCGDVTRGNHLRLGLWASGSFAAGRVQGRRAGRFGPGDEGLRRSGASTGSRGARRAAAERLRRSAEIRPPFS